MVHAKLKNWPDCYGVTWFILRAHVYSLVSILSTSERTLQKTGRPAQKKSFPSEIITFMLPHGPRYANRTMGLFWGDYVSLTCPRFTLFSLFFDIGELCETQVVPLRKSRFPSEIITFMLPHGPRKAKNPDGIVTAGLGLSHVLTFYSLVSIFSTSETNKHYVSAWSTLS